MERDIIERLRDAAPESAQALEAWERKCEDQLRSYMMGGVDPAELDPPASKVNAQPASQVTKRS